jgi:RNA polymerase sigma factor (sigma-70 family)
MMLPTPTLRAGRVEQLRTGLWALSCPDPRSRTAVDNSPEYGSPSAAAAGEFDDGDWISRVQAGDEEAARALVHRLYPTVVRSIRCRLPRRTSEEDVVQAVFAKIFKKLGQFSGRVPLEHWVSRIAVNTCLDQIKQESVRPELRMGDLSEEESAVVEHLTVTNDELPSGRQNAARELLARLLLELKPDERMVITLLHIEERSTQQVSRLTGWSISLVKVKAFRARNKLRKLWRTLLNGETL